MVKLWLFSLLIFSFLDVSGQKTGTEEGGLHAASVSRISFNRIYFGTDKDEVISKVNEVYSFSNSQLRLDTMVRSGFGDHYLFSQYCGGLKVYDASLKVNISKGYSISVFNSLKSITNISSLSFPDETSFLAIKGHYNPGSNDIFRSSRIIYEAAPGMITGAWHHRIRIESEKYFELITGENGSILYQKDLIQYSNKDTTASGFVFKPDPLTSAEKNYLHPYTDQSDSDVPELNAERKLQTIQVTHNDTFFILQNPFVKISEFSAPVTPIPTSNSGSFLFNRSEPGFEDVNVLYHITEFKKHLNSLGFTSVVNYQINVDAHALSNSDNSQFNSGFNPPRLFFGEGGVDDAEDADVIIHEYGHAVLNSTAPNTLGGVERQALDEAIGDYFAASYSRSISEFKYQEVFSWDGHNEFWGGRSVGSSKHYPEDLSGNYYSVAEIWSSAIMQIHSEIGGDLTETILINSTYSYSSGMTLVDAALLFLQVDSILYNSNYSSIIRRVFEERGLLKQANKEDTDETIEKHLPLKQDWEIVGHTGFAHGWSPLVITFPLYSDVQIELSDTRGIIVYENNYVSTRKIEINSGPIATGIYHLKIVSGTEIRIIRLIKY